MISYYLPSGSKIGVGYQAHAIATELDRRGHAVTVVSDCDPVEGAEYRHQLVRPSGRLRTFRFAAELRKLDLSAYDVVHAHGDDYWLWRRRARVHVRTMHGSCFEEALRIKGAIARLRMVMLGLSEVLASIVADVTVVVSPATRRWMPWVRHVVPNGVDATRFRPEPALKSDIPVVLFVGTWRQRKRGELLAEAFVRDVLPAHPNAELWMVSSDVPDAYHPAVKALGRVDDATLVRLYQQAWIFCLPSSYEGFGIPYAEAMSCGLPVVATPNIGARYVTDDGAAGVLAEPDELGVTIAKLLGDEAWRQELESKSLERAQQFALSRVVDEYLELYQSARR